MKSSDIRVLVVLTNSSKVEGYPNETGNWLEEVATPSIEFAKAGFQVDFASLLGGKCPLDPKSKTERAFMTDNCDAFLASTYWMEKLENSLKLSNINPILYDCVFCVGGHGQYDDWVRDKIELPRVIEAIDKRNGLVCFVCHGPIGIVNCTKYYDSSIPMVSGLKCTGFTNEEEQQVQSDDKVPYLVEEKLKELGGEFSKADAWKSYVLQNKNYIFGQNNFSAKAASEKVIQYLTKDVKRIALITSNYSKLEGYPKETGNWLDELASPYYIFKEKENYAVDIISISGGAIPIDPTSKMDDYLSEYCKRFLDDKVAQYHIRNTLSIDSVVPSKYDACFVVGGHGGYNDYQEKPIKSFIQNIYNNNGIVASVCHGQISLVDCTLADGQTPLVKGKNVTCFTNDEEKAIQSDDKVPFLVENKLREVGANFQSKEAWSPFIVTDGRLMTGQNNFSAALLSSAVVESIDKL